MHVVVAGNFNTTPGSRTYQLFTANSSHTPMTDDAQHRLGLKSAYAVFDAGREPEFTCTQAQWMGTTDFIFYTHSDLGVMEVLDFPPRELVQSSGMPSSEFSSNHFCLQSVFTTP